MLYFSPSSHRFSLLQRCVMHLFMVFCIVFASFAEATAVTYFYKAGSPDPNMPTSWNDNIGGGGADAVNFTTATDVFIIPAGRTAILTGNLSLGAMVTLTVDNGGTLSTLNFLVLGMGNFTLLAGGTLSTTNDGGFNGGAIQVAGTRTYNVAANYNFTPSAGPDKDINISSGQCNNLALFGGTSRINVPLTVNGAMTATGRVVICGANLTLQGAGPHIIMSSEIWIGGGGLTVNGTLNVNGTGNLALIGAGGGCGVGSITGTGTIVYAATARLNTGGDWTGTLDTPELPIAPTPMNGNLDLTGSGGPATIANDLLLNGNLTLMAAAGNEMILGAGRSLTLAGAGTILPANPGSKIQANNNNSVIVERTTISGDHFVGSWIYRLAINSGPNVSLVSNITAGNGGLSFLGAGHFDLNGNTLTLGDGVNFSIVGGGTGRILGTGAGSTVITQGTGTLDGNRFTGPAVTNLTIDGGGTNTTTLINNLTVGGTLSLPSAMRTLVLGNPSQLTIPTATMITGPGLINAQGAGSTVVWSPAAFPADRFVNKTLLNLTINSPVNVTLTNAAGTPLVIGGVLTMQGAGNFGVYVGGTMNYLRLLNAATLNIPGTGRLAMNQLNSGIEVQAAAFNANALFNNQVRDLQINRATNVALGGNLSLLGNLTIPNTGNFDLNGNNLTVAGTASFGALMGRVNAQGAGSHVIYQQGALNPANFLGNTFQNLTIDLLAGVTASGNITMLGTLNFAASNGSLNMGANTLILESLAAITQMGAGRVNLAAGGIAEIRNATLDGNWFTGNQVPTLRINRTMMPIGITLTNNLGAFTQLDMVNGIVTTAVGSAITLTNTATVVGGSATAHINGPMERDLNAAGTFIYPLGKGGVYLPFTINNPGATSTVRTEAFNTNAMGAPGTGMGNLSTAEHWRTQTLAGAWTAGNVTLQPTTAPIAGQLVGRSDGTVPAGTYNNIGGNVTPPTITSVNLTTTATAPSMFFLQSATLAIPTTASAIAFGTVNTTDFSGSFTAATPAPTGYLVVRRLAANAGTQPVNGTVYTVGNTFGMSTVIAVGAGTTFASAGLTANTNYSVDVFSYNGAGAAITYSSVPLSGNVTTLSGAVICTSGTIALPVTRNVLERNMQFTALAINGAGVISGAGTNNVFVNPGGQFQISYTYASTTSGSYCPGCVTQVYLGMNGVFTHCIATHVPQTSAGTGMTGVINAPVAPGIYYIALNASWDYSCYGTVGFSTNPADAIATIIVGAPCLSNAGDIQQPPAVPFVYPANIAYAANTNVPVTAANPAVWTFRVRDGGGAPDADFLPTVVTGFTLNLTDANNVVNRVALYDATGTTKLVEVAAAPVMNFTGLDTFGPLVTAPDGGNVDFIVRVSFRTSPVTDNSQFSLSLNGLTTFAGRSGMGVTMTGPSSTAGNDNRIVVTADRPSWLVGLGAVQPGTVGLNPLQTTPDVRVAAVDVNGNLDADYTGPIQLSNPPSLVGGPLTVNAVAGVATFTGANAVRHNTSGTMQLTARIGANTALSNNFMVNPALLTAAPNVVNFGNVALGQVVEQAVTLNGSTIPSNGVAQFALNHPHVSISATGGGAFATVASIALNPAPAAPSSPNGSTLTQTIFVRYAPTSNSAMNSIVSAGFTGSVAAPISLSGQGMSTSITTSATMLDYGTVFLGSSGFINYTLSAANIVGPLTLTATGPLQLSTTGTAPFTSSLTIYPSANTIPTQTITARFTPPGFGTTYSGTISHTNSFTTATVISWQGVGGNPFPTALGFAATLEISSTATGGVPGGLQDDTPFTVQAGAFRPDGVLANTNASVQVQVSAAPGGVASFAVIDGASSFLNTSRITIPNVRVQWLNAPLAGGTTQAIISLVRTSGNVLQSTQALITINKGPIIPQITGVSPTIIGSGSTVTITGTNFFSSTTVTFGGIRARSFVINSPTRITAVVAANGGSGDVAIFAPGGNARTRTMGNSTDTVRFFGPPVITDFNPKEAKAGDIITILGTNFDPSANAGFGGVEAQAVTVNSMGQLSARVAANGENGAVQVVAIGGSTTASVPFSFVRPPDVLSITPRLGRLGTEIIVTGANFKALREVWLGPVMITLATVNVISESEIRFRVPEAVSGAVTVRNIAGTAMSSDGFTFVHPPQIISMTPDSGSIGNQITIRGQNFIGVSSLTIGGVAPLQTFVVSSTQIVAIAGRGETGTAPVRLQTIGGATSSTIQFTFINPPQVMSIRPLIGGQRTVITITGANFSVIDRVTIGGVDARSFEVISTTQIVAVVSDDGGSGLVQVTNRLGASNSREQFTFLFPPLVQNFDPMQGSTGSTITINGGGFVSSTTTIVTVGGVPVAEYEVVNPTRIIAVVSTGATGRVAVRTDGGFSETPTVFRFVPPTVIPPPRIINFAPDSAAPGDVVLVEGLNFINVRSVRLSGVTIATFSVNSASALSFIMPERVSSGTLEIQTTTGTAIARKALIAIPPRVILTPLQRDSLALVQIYRSTNGEDWTRKRNWLTVQPLSQWQGVVIENNRVSSLTLDSAGLRGLLPIAVSNLTAMRTLRLTGNSLEGAFPQGLLLLPDLQELQLAGNFFTGEIPAGISSMAGLTTLNLSRNSFSGAIPNDVCRMGRLREINLANNRLIGTIPACLGQLAVLERLDLSNNQLTGGIPTDFGALTGLQELLLNNNILSGTLPRTVWASANNLLAEKGTAGLTNSGLRSLRRLNLSNNQFTGELPSELFNSTLLQELLLANNQLRGTIPSALGGISTLRVFDISQNQFSGVVPSAIRDLRMVERFAVSRNQFSGTLPAEVAQMVNLREFAVDNNAFSGSAPDGLATLGRLQILRLQGNRFTAIPNLSAVSSLTVLAVENNRLQFETLEANLRSAATAFSYTYSPQDSVGEARDTAAAVGLPFGISARMRSENNRYQWFKNGREINGATQLVLTFPAFSRLDTGSYNVRVTNTAVRGLTLFSRSVRVMASAAPVPSSPPLLLQPTSAAQNVSLNAQFEWLPVLGATAYDIHVAQDSSFRTLLWDTTVSAAQVRIASGLLRSFSGYAWRVRARNESGVSAWSPAWLFTTIDAGALVQIPTTDIGRSVVGRTRSGFVDIVSVSDVPVRIIGARLEGTDVSSFRIDSAAAPFRDSTIRPFGRYRIRVNFTPSSLGLKQARLVVAISNGTASTERSGNVRGTPTFVEVNDLNFDTVLVGIGKVRNLLVSNVGRDTIRIRENIRIMQSENSMDSSSVFRLDASAPQAPYTILPNETLFLPIVAISSQIGETSATAIITTTLETFNVRLQASVREKSERDELLRLSVTPSITVATPGSRIRVNVGLVRSASTATIEGINRAGNPSFSFNIRMNRNVLIPAPNETKLIPGFTPGVYRVEQDRITLPVLDSTTFLSFDCLVVAGNTNVTDIELFEPVWQSPQIFQLPPINGRFTANVSRAGGVRLIAPVTRQSTSATVITSVTPNPASAETTVSYEMLSSETIEIMLYDARGNALRTLLPPTEQREGEHQISVKTADLASGQYRIVIKTPFGAVQREITVVR